jgi:hypothetical protein
MAYHGEHHVKQIAYIMQIYEEWKERNGDRPDTFFVSRILPQRGYFMSYQGFMNGYKSKFYGKRNKTKDRKQLSLFA